MAAGGATRGVQFRSSDTGGTASVHLMYVQEQSHAPRLAHNNTSTQE